MKKKSSIYLLIPVVLLVLFSAYYWNFISGYDAKQEAREAQIVRARHEKLEADNVLRRKAVDDAMADQAKRKAEREAKADQARKEADATAAALQARDHALVEVGKVKEKYYRLVADVKTEKEAIAKIEDDKKVRVAELDFLQIETAKAETNVQNLTAVMNQIAAADAAFDAAAAAAKAAAAKK